MFARQLAKAHGYFIANELPFKQLGPGYSLALGHPNDGRNGLPMISYLCLAGPKSVFPVRGLDDFRGAVKLSSSKDALAFVRLRTSPVTCRTFGIDSDVWCEIVEASTLRADFCLGQMDSKGFRGEFSGGYFGGVSHKTFLACRLAKPVIKKDGSNFIVSRYVVIWTGNRPKTFKVGEEVSQDGEYRVISSEPLRTPEVLHLQWYLPDLK